MRALSYVVGIELLTWGLTNLTKTPTAGMAYVNMLCFHKTKSKTYDMFGTIGGTIKSIAMSRLTGCNNLDLWIYSVSMPSQKPVATQAFVENDRIFKEGRNVRMS